MPNDSQIQKAFDAFHRVVELQKAGIMWFLDMGKTLYEIREDKLYNYMGNGGFDTYRQFLHNPEIGFSEQSAYLYTSVYEFYCLKLGYGADEIKDLPLNRLKKLIPLLKDKTIAEAKAKVEESRGLTLGDFEAETSQEEQGDKPQVWLDPETRKWIIEFLPKYTLRVTDKTNGKNLLS
jgi:hypothetical protein